MAKVWGVIHPANVKVGDEVEIVEIEVPTDEDAERLNGWSWPTAL